jgi:integrase
MGLIDFFGPDKPLKEITPGDADEYKLKLLDTPIKQRGNGKNKKKLSSMTVRKRLQFAKMIFRAAVRHKIIPSNPFDDVGIKATMPGMARFVTVEEYQKLLDACPNQDWRTIVALSRMGGFRCPSEVLSLKIADIDWEKNRILVTSPKTAHHPGKATRTIPLFPELRRELLASCEAAPEGAVYVVNAKFRESALGPQGWRNCNLRTTFETIVACAGLERWPRLFHNLRASRQTELSETFPSHVVCAWLGNSEEIAREHYLKITDGHFDRASGTEPPKALQKALQSGVTERRMTSHGVTQTCEIPEENDIPREYTSVQADGEGFEPTVDFRPRRFSRPVP